MEEIEKMTVSEKIIMFNFIRTNMTELKGCWSWTKIDYLEKLIIDDLNELGTKIDL